MAVRPRGDETPLHFAAGLVAAEWGVFLERIKRPEDCLGPQPRDGGCGYGRLCPKVPAKLQVAGEETAPICAAAR